jgi:hypothetical protein
MITFLYKIRTDNTYVIEHELNPYHVTADDDLYPQCADEYEALEVEPPDEPAPEAPPVREDPMTALVARIEALEKAAR